MPPRAKAGTLREDRMHLFRWDKKLDSSRSVGIERAPNP